MSSIERAMDKLAGEDVAPPTGDADGAAPPAVTPAGAVAAAPATATPPPSAPATPPPVASSAPVATSSQPEPRPAATAAPKTGSAVANERSFGEQTSANFVRLDLDRMMAAGFLVPDQPMNRQSEEYQHIKRRLLGNMVPGILNQPRPPNLILITSSVPGEGKTFTSTNLAISIAMEVDHTVLAIDTDIMKRDLSKVFGVADRRGLFDLLADSRLDLPSLLVRTSIPNLVILPAGNRRDGSTELLASVRMRELADEIATRYHDRVVLFDSPPVLATTTATALAPLVGQIVLVAEAGKTKHETIREALARLDHVRVTGVILNKAKQQLTPGYDYYGSYYNVR